MENWRVELTAREKRFAKVKISARRSDYVIVCKKKKKKKKKRENLLNSGTELKKKSMDHESDSDNHCNRDTPYSH